MRRILLSGLSEGNAIACRAGSGAYATAVSIVRLVSIIVCMVPLMACTEYLEERAVKKTVIKYNEALSLTYKEVDEAHVAPYASSGQMAKIKRVMHPLMIKNSRMVTVMENLEIKDIKRERDKALVETDERWEYWFEDRATDKMEGGKEKIRYENTYTLVKKNDQWIVDDLQTIVK